MSAPSQRNPRRPSLSMAKPMSWLSSSGGSRSTASSPITISEPKLIHDIFIGSAAANVPARYGPLGSGATVVRTPQDALSNSMRTRTNSKPPPPQRQEQRPRNVPDSDTSSYEENEPPSPTSPPLPPVPFSKSTPEFINIPDTMPTSTNLGSMARQFPSRFAPRTPPGSRIFIPVSIPECPPQSTFAPILLSPPPHALLTLPTLMITLDTSTSSLRTTYSTLTSRPSYLTDYLSAVVNDAQKRKFCDTLVEVYEEEEQQREEEEDAHTIPPPDTPFASLFNARLNSVGLIPQSAESIHLFLDRPSAPYTHILTYLRSPITAPPMLPRSVSLGHSFTQERFDALLELRDEAKYLGMEELYQLCCDELHRVQVQHQGHARASSGSSSIRSNHTGNNNNNTNSSAVHSLIIPGSLDRGRTPGMMHILREHQITSSKLPHVVGLERHSGSSGSVVVSHVAQIVEPSPNSPVFSPARSRSTGDKPGPPDGWI